MDAFVTATVYPCHEYGEVAVPITELFVDGEVDVFPEITGKGFFDIDFRQGKIVLKAKNYVGLIPINSRVSIHVIPKVPVGNILYILHRAKQDLRYLPNYVRGYQVRPLAPDQAEEIFASALVDCLIGLERHGLLRRYVPYVTERGWRGRMLMAPMISRHRAKGDRFHQTRQVYELSPDIPENQILKETLYRVVRRLSTLRNTKSQALVEKAIPSSYLFDRISPFPRDLPGAGLLILNCVQRLPGSHKFYERSLWLCYFIATQGDCTVTYAPNSTCRR